MKELEINRDVLMLDLAVLPQSMTIEDAIFYSEHGYIFCDSTLKTNFEIKVLPKKTKLVIWDISTEEGRKIYEDIKLKYENTGRKD